MLTMHHFAKIALFLVFCHVPCDRCECSYSIYRIARYFRGLNFSQMSLARTFRDLIFKDCIRAQRRLTAGKVLEDKIFEVRH